MIFSIHILCSSMESLIIPIKSNPLMQIPLDFSLKPTKATLSLTKTHQPFSSKTPHVELLTALDSISHNGCKLRADTFIHLLDRCIAINSVQLGRELHARIHFVDEVNPFVETKLISMYAICGCLDDARKVFDKMSERNLFTWSAIIGAYIREKRWREVVGLFGMMMQEGVLPDGFLFPRILQACGNCEDYETGRLVHSVVVRSGMSSRRRVSNALLSVYAKCGRLSLARRIFEEMHERDMVSWNSMISGYCLRGYNQSGDCDAAMELMSKMGHCGVTPDVFTWTSMISGHTQNNRIVEALDLFRDMLLVGVEPNEVTVASVLSACAAVKSLEMGKELHSFAVKIGLSDSVLVGNATVDMYSKCGELEAAREVFDLISEKDVYTWNSMIGGYCQGGYCGKAHNLFIEMQKSEVQPNVVTWNIMISGYIQNRDEDQAMDLFHMMGKEGIVKPDTSSWNSLISGYLQIGLKNKALGVFRQMQSSSFRPNSVTILTILPACANLIAANKVKEIHASVLRRSLDSQIAILNSLIDTYAKSGNIVYSRSIFNWMLPKDIITWNSLIAGYVLHGCSDDALDAFGRMKKEGYRPNRFTFVSLILAYSREKMVEKGKQIFNSMVKDYQILPGTEHYSAMVDLFGRSGRLKEAVNFIERMEIEPVLAVWEALLTASRNHGNIGLMIHAGEHLLKLNPGNSMTNHLVSQAYSVCARSMNPLKVISPSGNKDITKDCGCSLLELKNMVYSFISGDRSTPGFDSLYTWLKSIPTNMKPSNLNMSSIHEEDNEEISGLHSEKLALAFALVSTHCELKCIRIVKNFRICDDCHHTAKYISTSYGCEILLSDTKCLHHIKNGCCSCGDYW